MKVDFCHVKTTPVFSWDAKMNTLSQNVCLLQTLF